MLKQLLTTNEQHVSVLWCWHYRNIFLETIRKCLCNAHVNEVPFQVEILCCQVDLWATCLILNELLVGEVDSTGRGSGSGRSAEICSLTHFRLVRRARLIKQAARAWAVAIASLPNSSHWLSCGVAGLDKGTLFLVPHVWKSHTEIARNQFPS